MVNVPALRNRERMIDVPEQRSGAGPLEFREDKATGQVLLRGYAATYEPYDCYGGPDAGGWVEQLRGDAFQKTLRAQPDVMLLLNHTGAPLARTKSGTMTLSCDRRGLLVEAQLDPSDPDVQALLPKMRRGDLDEMSFAFRVKDQEWNDDYTHRTIREVSLQKGDVSVVNYGMNPNTRVAVAEGTLGALAELSMDQLAELRNLDGKIISRAISNLTKVKEIRAVSEGSKRQDSPFPPKDEEDDDTKDEESTEEASSDEEEGQEKCSDNPFAEDEPEPEDNEEEEEEEKLSAARALKSTLDAALKVADDQKVRQLLARAQGQLNQLRGKKKNGPSDVEKMLQELRKEAGDSEVNTVAEGLEYLRQQGTAPLLWPASFKV